MAKVKKILRVVSTILEWIVFAVLIGTFIIVLSPLLPTKRYIYTYIVASGSMEPSIHTGSVAFVTPVKVNTLKKGDIITFTSPKDQKVTVLHRIYDIKEKNKLREFITKGDNNNAPDNWQVAGATIKGKFLFSIPYIGHIGAFVKTLRGFGIIVVIPALFLALLQIRTIKLGIEEEVQRRSKSSMKNVVLLIFIMNGLLLSSLHTYAQALFISSATVSGISISVVDFIPPSVPTGLRYLSPEVACGGITNSSTITPDWGDSTAHGSKYIDHYEYESVDTYGFRVRAVDNLGYMSDWTSDCTVIYDTTKPKSIITTGLSLNDENESLRLHAHFTNTCDWDGLITGTATDDNSGVKEVLLSIYRPIINKYWTETGWTAGTEALARVTATGIDSWQYQLPNHPTGIYIIKSHAVDNANNIENTYTLTLDNTDPTVFSTPSASLTMSDDKKTVSFSATNINDVKLSYELSYDAYSSAKGVIGSDVDVSGLTEYKKENIDLATCSGTVCTYDQNVANIKLTITLVDKNGTETKLEKALSI